MSTQFRPIEIPPGVIAKATKKMNSTAWAEVNLVRWSDGQLSPMGGQSQYEFTFASRCKAVHGWYDLAFTYYTAFLCEQHLYVETNGVLTDITPIDGIVPPVGLVGAYGDGYYGDGTYGTSRDPPVAMQPSELPDCFSLDNFGQILYAMTSADGRLLKWDPTIPPTTTQPPGKPHILGAGTCNGAFIVGQTVIPMQGGVPAAPPGSSVFDKKSKMSIGVVQSIVAGTPPAFTLTLAAGSLAASQTDHDFLEFLTNPGGLDVVPPVAPPAVVQPADSGRGVVPLGRCFVITPERFVMILGAYQDGTNPDGVTGGGFNRFAWCDQENPGAWDYSSVVSQAGFLDIEPSSPVLTALCTKTGTLIWTGKKVYRSQFLGSPYIYNCQELGDNSPPWSPQSATTTTLLALWMSDQGMFAYDGTSIISIPCPVRAWVLDDIDLLNVREQACCSHVSDFSEFWWFFPQNGQLYNTRAIIFNYKEGWWSQARMSRSAGNTSAYNAFTVMADGLVAFQHELGPTYANADLPFAETFDLNLTSGSRLITIKQVIPDIEGDISNIQYSLFYRNSRSTGTPENQTQPVRVRPDGYVDFRTTGRDIRLRFDLIGPQVLQFTLGQHLIDGVPRGDR